MSRPRRATVRSLRRNCQARLSLRSWSRTRDVHGSGTPFWTKRSIEAVNGEHFALFSFDFRPVLGRNGPFEVRQLGRMNFWFVVKPLPFFGFFCSWGGAFWHLPPPLSVGRYYGRLGRFWFEGRQLLLSFPSSGPSRRNRSHFASAVGENVSIFTCLFERCAVLLRLSPHAIYADFAYLFARSRWVDWNNALNYLVMGIIASHIISYPRYSRSVW